MRTPRVVAADFSNTPAVDPVALKQCIDLASTFGYGRSDADWLRAFHAAIKARWSDQNTALALWVRSRALLLWAFADERVESDGLQRGAWLAARAEGPHPLLVEWAARIQAGATYPLTTDGRFDPAFQQAITQAKTTT